MNEISDSELIMLTRENNEDAEDIIYKKYKKVLIPIISNYKNTINAYKIDYAEIYACGLNAISDAIKTYNDNITMFSTYVELIINRYINKYIRDYIRKYKDELGTIEYELSSNKYDPYIKLITNDTINNINIRIKKTLSKREKDILKLLILGYSYNQIKKELAITNKQLYNAIYQIKAKLKQKD